VPGRVNRLHVVAHCIREYHDMRPPFGIEYQMARPEDAGKTRHIDPGCSSAPKTSPVCIGSARYLQDLSLANLRCVDPLNEVRCRFRPRPWHGPQSSLPK
jgi:hypothetical protein